MAIRKFGTEPAKVQTRDEDNDQETLDNLKSQAMFESSPAAAEVDESLASQDSSEVRNRRQ